jgi:hypothetical protein
VVSQKAPAPTAAKIAAVVSTRSVSAHVMCLPIAPARRPPISRLGGWGTGGREIGASAQIGRLSEATLTRNRRCCTPNFFALHH